MAPFLPAELQFQIIEASHWTILPVLSQVCSLWRHHIKTSKALLESKYTYFPRNENLEIPAVCFHRAVTWITHFVRFEDEKLRLCHIDDDDDVKKLKGGVEIDTAAMEFNWRLFADDPLRLQPTDGQITNCAPSQPDYLDVGHPSVLCKFTLEHKPGKPFIPMQRDRNVGRLFAILIENANWRWASAPLSGTPRAKVVRVVPELYDFGYLGGGEMETIEVQIASTDLEV
ncbi:hypothetical protein TWF730_004409 [Orbilia blumenaviensis]|uniref:F-box domain-containing protein n=1 Tax=Orbilia blumenaviensis TaxID=1796055 RepID=A0AAV9TZ06_9PEZI